VIDDMIVSRPDAGERLFLVVNAARKAADYRHIATRLAGRAALEPADGLAMLALGEFLSLYSFVFPETIMYFASNVIKIGGLVALFIPVSRIPLTRIKIEDEAPDLDTDDLDPSKLDK